MVEGRNSTAGCRVSTFDEAARALATCHARVPVPKSMPSPGPSLFMATSCVCVGVCARAPVRACVRSCVCVCGDERGKRGGCGSSVLRRACGPRTRAAHACAPGTGQPHLLCRVLDALLHRHQQLRGHRAAVPESRRRPAAGRLSEGAGARSRRQGPRRQGPRRQGAPSHCC